MSQTLSHPQISEIEEVCKRNRVKKLSIFGSALRDELGPESDIDLLVEFDPSARIGFLDLARTARELSEVYGRRVDLVLKSGLKSLIREEVLNESEIVFAA
jgi:hypothetical protein